MLLGGAGGLALLLSLWFSAGITAGGHWIPKRPPDEANRVRHDSGFSIVRPHDWVSVELPFDPEREATILLDPGCKGMRYCPRITVTRLTRPPERDEFSKATLGPYPARLELHGCTAFDIQAVCTGFIYALGTAEKFIRSGTHKCALVIGAETFSRLVDWTDRDTCVLFGDGAGAVVLEASDEPGILSSHLHADGAYEKLLHVPGGVSRGFENAGEEGDPRFTQMRGNEVFKVAVNTLGRIVDETLEANGMKKSDVDWLVPHQANIRIINATARKLNMNMDRVVVTVDQHGNTSAASVPLALDTAVRDGRIKPGETLLLEAFGGGFTWGSVLLKF